MGVQIPVATMKEPEQRLEAWVRVVPYVLLVISMVPYLITESPTAAEVGRTLAVAGLTAAWVAWWATLHPQWADRRVLMGIYFVGFAACCALLVARSPWFGFFCWVGYIHAYRYLASPLRFAGLFCIACLSAIAQLGGFHPPTPAHLLIFAVVACLNAVLVIVFIYLGQKAEDQNTERKRVIVDLAEANRQLEAMMAENAGLHAQLLVQAREAGVLAERQRMAREIHDTLAQGLAGIITQLEAAQQAGLRAPAEAAWGRPDTGAREADWERRISNAARLARESLAEARRSVRAVRPEALENTKLPEALTEVADRWSAINGVRATVTTTGNAQGLHPEVEVTLLRVAQEALANVAKHANASRVGITVSYMDDVVTLDVRDDGVGFRLPGPWDPASGGFGLTTMRQRVQRLAGQLAIESEPGSGTAVSASVPAIVRGTAGAAYPASSGPGSPATEPAAQSAAAVLAARQPAGEASGA